MLGLAFVVGKRSARLLLYFAVLSAVVTGQTQQNPAKPSQDEIVRVFTELVQTDVMVFDKQGRFVQGLGRENFELRIDGKVKPIQSFEQITAGSDEEAQLSAARGSTALPSKKVVPLDRGRTVYFYIDDFHMDPAGINASRKVISRFVENDMGQNDQVAIASATGQIGFLQQLTENRNVLKAALERITPRSYSVRDFEHPPMSEYQAILIDRLDPNVLEVFITETIRQNPGLNRETAAAMVRSRAQSIVTQAGYLTNNTLMGLESLVRSAKAVPGRKVVFLLSNGFLLENRRSDTLDRLRQITDAAGKSGVVIYSIDTRGLTPGLPDASSEVVFDPSGRLQSSALGELSASQNGLYALAVDTGGRAIMNTNDLSKGVAPAVKESSVYYLLAWKPDNEGQKRARFRKIDVSIVGRSDLVVRVRRGYFDIDPAASAEANASKKSDSKKTVVAKLRDAILATYPVPDIPLTLSLDYFDVPGKGITLATAVGVAGEFLVFGEHDGKVQAIVDVTGVFYNDKGPPVNNFMERIVTTAPNLESSKDFDRELIYHFPVTLGPGLYQVRVAARDDKSGKIGSTQGWVQIPDLSKKQFTTSSLLIGERKQSTVTNVSKDTYSPIPLSANHRFEQDSMLRLLIVAYNAALSTTDQKPDLAVQVQLLRDDQPVVTTALRKVGVDGMTDLTRVPYAAEIPLTDLKPGRYVLQVSIIDKVAKQSASQHTHVDIY